MSRSFGSKTPAKSGLGRGTRKLAPFFERVRRGHARALLLDFDGTLAPFVNQNADAVMYPGVRSALLALILEGRCRVAVVSGRSMPSLRRAVGLDGGVELWASHGLERLTTEGCWIGPRRPPALTRLLDAATATLGARWPEVVERKRYGLALHSRGRSARLFAQARRALLDEWAEPAQGAGLALCRFDGGIELRPAGLGKDAVVKHFLSELGAEAVVAYLGDDRTDEDAFRALKGRGLGVLVRPEPRPTLADVWIRPPAGLLTFLVRWNAACCLGGDGVRA